MKLETSSFKANFDILDRLSVTHQCVGHSVSKFRQLTGVNDVFHEVSPLVVEDDVVDSCTVYHLN